MMGLGSNPIKRGQWRRKFKVAYHGLTDAARTENSFRVHLPVAIAVVAVGVWFRIESWRWVAIVLAITGVVTAELLNTSVERLVRALHPEHDEVVGQSLDAAAAGVLAASIGAALVGLIAIGPPLWEWVMPLAAPSWGR